MQYYLSLMISHVVARDTIVNYFNVSDGKSIATTSSPLIEAVCAVIIAFNDIACSRT